MMTAKKTTKMSYTIDAYDGDGKSTRIKLTVDYAGVSQSSYYSHLESEVARHCEGKGIAYNGDYHVASSSEIYA